VFLFLQSNRGFCVMDLLFECFMTLSRTEHMPFVANEDGYGGLGLGSKGKESTFVAFDVRWT
jgi:hypothetical protein